MYIYNWSQAHISNKSSTDVSLLPEEARLLVLLGCRNDALILGRIFNNKFLVMRVGH